MPFLTVKVAARCLPSSHRDRYRQEFTAELHAMLPQEQKRYAVQVLLRTWALRAALDRPAAIGEAAMSTASSRTLACLLHWHKWKTCYTEDGGRYVACRRCGKDMPPSGLGNITLGA